MILLMERSRGQVIANNLGEVYERGNPLISAFGVDIDGAGKKFILNRQNMIELQFTHILFHIQINQN